MKRPPAPTVLLSPGPQPDQGPHHHEGDRQRGDAADVPGQAAEVGVSQALAGELDAWGAEAAGSLALVLLLDQFPRQIWRDTAMAFAGDPQALAESLQAVERGWLEAEPEQARRQFWLRPLMHSEDLTVQEAALPLFERFCDPRTADFVRRHRDVIARFGRFPHRNAVLGRVSSAEVLAFLQTPGSRF